MSRRTTMEFVGAQRRAYAQLKSKAKKTALINSMCQAFGFDRKYANKLLTGNRRYKDPKGRGRTYSDKAVDLLRRVWYATGCMCTKYLKAIIVQALANLAELEHVDPSVSAEVAAMSASTMDRAVKGLERKGPGSVRKNRRSGKNDPATYFTCCSGEKTIAAETEPGHLQVDTVALCGGDMHGNFFWIITLTDRKTQWTEIYPVWNRGAAEVLNAMRQGVHERPSGVIREKPSGNQLSAIQVVSQERQRACRTEERIDSQRPLRRGPRRQARAAGPDGIRLHRVVRVLQLLQTLRHDHAKGQERQGQGLRKEIRQATASRTARA